MDKPSKLCLDYHRRLTRTGTQTHIYSGRKNPAVLPQLGTILYRRRKYKSKSTKINPQGQPIQPTELTTLVVVYFQSKSRGINKGIVDIVSLLPVIKIDQNEVYYDYSANPFILRLTNRGKWFTKSLLKLYDLSWDQTMESVYLNSMSQPKRGLQLSPPIAASTESAQNFLLNPASYSILPILPILSPVSDSYPQLIDNGNLQKSLPIQIIKPNPKIQNSADLSKFIGRSWETDLIKIPERDRSNSISIPGVIPSFVFPVGSPGESPPFSTSKYMNKVDVHSVRNSE
uniref:Uncharacterized protein n=1 Tax=Pithovirus LCPAC201 TaxID=2506591 RepID=A0A481Z4P9_9VIRU|nr:MAG: hypothetical protein LCPAC201_01690 [Pithovirus LCPAC201]